MGEPAKSIGSGHRLQCLANGFLQYFIGPGPDPSQKGFELGEGFFDRGEIRRIGRQEEQLTAAGLDELSYPLPFVHTQIVQHHDLARHQARSQKVFDLRFKDPRIHGPLDEHRGAHALER